MSSRHAIATSLTTRVESARPPRAPPRSSSLSAVTRPARDDTSAGTAKFAVVQLVTVNEAGQYDEAEIKQRIREQLIAERATRSLLDELRKQTYVAIRLE